MVKHVIIWTFKPEFSQEQKAEYANKIKKELEALKELVDGAVEIKVVTDILDSSSGDIMLDSSFADEQALNNYQTHPEHLKAAGFVKSVVSDRRCIDYKI